MTKPPHLARLDKEATVDRLMEEITELKSTLAHVDTCLSILRNEADILEIPRLATILKE